MHIDHYNFGQIGIDDHSYDADVIVFPDHVQERWWRREGHRLARQDLETVLADVPRMLVIGTGYYGRMKVPEETIDSLRAAGVDVRVARTSEAVDGARIASHRPRGLSAISEPLISLEEKQ